MRVARIAPLAALLLIGATPALAQQAPARPEGYKDPGTAQLIGLLAPGAGQIWIGGDKQKKGFTLLAIGYGAPIAAVVAAAGSDSYAPELVGLGVTLATGIYGIVSADDARDHNRRLGGRVALLERVQPVVAPGGAGAAVGLSLRF